MQNCGKFEVAGFSVIIKVNSVMRVNFQRVFSNFVVAYVLNFGN